MSLTAREIRRGFWNLGPKASRDSPHQIQTALRENHVEAAHVLDADPTDELGARDRVKSLRCPERYEDD